MTINISDYDQLLIVARHAESEANAAISSVERDDKRKHSAIYYPISGSDERVALTERGKKQAEALGRQLRQLLRADKPIDEVLVSEFRRTTDTADIMLREIGQRAPLIVEPRINKRRYGKFWNLTYLGTELFYPEEYEKYLSDLKNGGLTYAPPGGDGHQDGESYLDLFTRVDEFVDELIAEREPFIKVAVGHLSTLLAFERKFEKLPDTQVVQLYNKQVIEPFTSELRIYGRRLDGDSFARLSLTDADA